MNDTQRARMEETIHQMVAELLVKKIKDPRVSNVSITRVEISKDYSLAKISYNIIGSKDDLDKVAEGLKSCSGFIRRNIKKHVRLRVIPELIFIYDSSLDRAMKLEELIDQIHRENQKGSINHNGGIDGD